ncbi:MAG: nucleotidyltransferase domain-containing protein [Nanoarchaeota archaeon]|nr:nucleotidyltransferase domain-containing protein [Nanoarchaeota archaeon]
MENLTKEIILEMISFNKDKFKEFGVKKLILFGSYARDEQNENSDIDFLIEYEENRGNYRDSLDVLHLLEDLFNRKIDLGEIKSLRNELKPYIMKSIQYETSI